MDLLNTTKNKVLAAVALIIILIVVDFFVPRKRNDICEEYCLTKAEAFQGLVTNWSGQIHTGRFKSAAYFTIQTESRTFKIFKDVNSEFYKKLSIGDSVFKEAGTLEAKIVTTPQIPSLSIFNREILKEFDSHEIKDCNCK